MVRIELIFALSLLSLFCGCQTDRQGKVIPSERATVVLQEANGESIRMKVSSSAHEESRVGVKALADERWQDATAALSLAVEADPSDHRSQFALGIAYEQCNLNEEALTHYKKAIFYMTSKDMLYGTSKRRVQAKLQNK